MYIIMYIIWKLCMLNVQNCVHLLKNSVHWITKNVNYLNIYIHIPYFVHLKKKKKCIMNI